MSNAFEAGEGASRSSASMLTAARLQRAQNARSARRGAETVGGMLPSLIPLVRERLALSWAVSESAIGAALTAIAAANGSQERWMAAFSSDLGRHLAANGRDLNTALRTLVALVPEPSN